MDVKHAIAYSHVEGPPAPLDGIGSAEASERVRRLVANAWGRMGPAWGVGPAVARVHGYLLATRAPLTEREVRLALGLSHRAASLALAESEAWGLIERVPEPRRAGRRGPAGTAYVAVGDHWRWFGRVVAQRKLREGDPVLGALAAATLEAAEQAKARPDDADLADLSAWLTDFLGFVRLFDRALGLVPQIEPRETQSALELLGRLPDDVALRLVRLLASLPAEELVPLLQVASRLSPSAARRVVRGLGPLLRAAGGRGEKDQRL